MKVLVTGPRDYDDAAYIEQVLLRVLSPRPTRVIHGDAGDWAATRGADRIAGRIAAEHGIEVKAYPADWYGHGKAAGPIRNGEMLKRERPDLVVAFKRADEETRGTNNMIDQARAAGVPVRVFRSGGGVGWEEGR